MKTLRNKFLVTLIATMFLCLSLAVAFATNTTKAYATVDDNAFAMANGAEIALNKDGLRFRVQMGQNVYDEIFTNDAEDNVKLSVLIAPKSYFEELDASANVGEYQLLSKKIEIDIDDAQKVYKQGDYYYANAVLTNLAMANNANITKDQFDYEFVAVGCIATTDGSETTYKYASFFDGDMANNVRSQYELAQAAVLFENDANLAYASDVLNAEGPYASWFGSENYPINVDSAEEYSVLQAKVEAGLDTQANFNVYNKWTSLAGGTISDRENLPENTTFYHYVSYYDEDTTTLLDKVEVKEGETAVTTKSYEYEELNYSHNRVYESYINAWLNVAGTQSVADLSNITSNKRVYALRAKRDISQTLLAEASAANPDVALFFGERFGYTQLSSGKDSTLSSTHPLTHANKEYHPDMSYGGMQGMTSYTVYNTNSKDLRMVFKININKYFTYNAGDYVKFYVYSELTTSSTTARTLVRCNNQNGVATVCDNYDWSEIVFPVEEFVKKDTNGNTFLSFGAFGCNPTTTTDEVYKFYISNVVRVPASEVYRMDDCELKDKYGNPLHPHTDETVDSDYTWTIGDGDVEILGPVYRFDSTWTSSTYHGNIGEIDQHVYYIENSLVYGGLATTVNGFPHRSIGLTFAQKITGKIYVTAKGFGSGAGMRYFTDGKETGSTLWLEFTKLKDLGNGFAVWEMDFGTTEVAYVRLCGYGQHYQQVIISNISTTNPVA